MWMKLLAPLAIPFIKGVGKLAIKLIPVERILAWLLNKWLAQVDPERFDHFVHSAKHVTELGDLLAQIMEDRQITPDEASEARLKVMRLREILLEDWAHGRSSKDIEKMIAK